MDNKITTSIINGDITVLFSVVLFATTISLLSSSPLFIVVGLLVGSSSRVMTTASDDSYTTVSSYETVAGLTVTAYNDRTLSRLDIVFNSAVYSDTLIIVNFDRSSRTATDTFSAYSGNSAGLRVTLIVHVPTRILPLLLFVNLRLAEIRVGEGVGVGVEIAVVRNSSQNICVVYVSLPVGVICSRKVSNNTALEAFDMKLAHVVMFSNVTPYEKTRAVTVISELGCAV